MLVGLNFSTLDSPTAESLESSFTEEEIVAAFRVLMWESPSVKWVYNGILAFLLGDSEGWCHAYLQGIFLVWEIHEKFKLYLHCAGVKKEGDIDFKDFRPISLVGSLYKLLG